MAYSVIVEQPDSARSEDTSYQISGFKDWEQARECARRLTRASIEKLRQPGMSREQLRDTWRRFGDRGYVIAFGGDPVKPYAAAEELDFFLDHPATPEECDWKTIVDGRKRG